MQGKELLPVPTKPSAQLGNTSLIFAPPLKLMTPTLLTYLPSIDTISHVSLSPTQDKSAFEKELLQQLKRSIFEKSSSMLVRPLAYEV